MGPSPGDLLTAGSFIRARRRLAALPAAYDTRLDYVPVRSGLVELRAAINERPVVPSDRWTYIGIGAMAAARREVDYGIASPSGGGELFTVGWRFWPDRPRYALTVAAPVPRAGIVQAAIFSERQPFDRSDLPRAARTAAVLSVGNWLTSLAHVEARGGLEDWTGAGKVGRAGATLRLQSPGDRLGLRLLADAWRGDSAFNTASIDVTGRTSTERAGRVWIARAGAGAASGGTPADGWFAGDTGATRPILLRAHPVVEDGELRTNQLGRRILHGSVEVQQWRRVSLARVGGAVFLDAARVGARLTPDARSDVDLGAGVRLALPGVGGIFRGDLARGLRDRATTFSFVYEP
jgi:hypothetical protein